MVYKAIFKCKAGHTQTITLPSDYTMEMAKDFAGLMDGSSPIYIYLPGPESMIGKCCWSYPHLKNVRQCGEPYKITIEEEVTNGAT